MTIATGVDPVFSHFYVAKEGGLFEKNGLDVTINTGPSGSAMVAFLVNNQVQAAYGSELAGVTNHNLDPNVVAVADGTTWCRWLVGGRPQHRHAWRGSRARRSASPRHRQRGILARVLEKLNLNAADYTMVNVEAPEMVAALERGNIDAFAVWEPWLTRTLQAVKGTKIAATSEGIFNHVELRLHEPRLDRAEQGHGREVHAVADAGQRPHREGPTGRRPRWSRSSSRCRSSSPPS